MILLKVLSLLFIAFAIAQESSAVCDSPLGMESGGIADSQISASTSFSLFDHHTPPRQGRLNYKETTSISGSWSAGRNDPNQWLQIYLGQAKISRIATQGRNYNPSWPYGSHAQWVTKYKLQYSNEGPADFFYYKENGEVKEFTGNSDQDTVVQHVFSPPIDARFIRFVPAAWHDHISMRVEVYGCQLACMRGLQLQLSASSKFDNDHAASYGILNTIETTTRSGAWAAGRNDPNQWLQADLGSLHNVQTVATQGRNYNENWQHGYHTQWVTKYKLQYSNNVVTFQYYMEQGVVKEFAGNTDRDIVVFHDLISPVNARYFRFRPTDWHDHISMRVALFGCQGR